MDAGTSNRRDGVSPGQGQGQPYRPAPAGGARWTRQARVQAELVDAPGTGDLALAFSGGVPMRNPELHHETGRCRWPWPRTCKTSAAIPRYRKKAVESSSTRALHREKRQGRRGPGPSGSGLDTFPCPGAGGGMPQRAHGQKARGLEVVYAPTSPESR